MKGHLGKLKWLFIFVSVCNRLPTQNQIILESPLVLTQEFKDILSEMEQGNDHLFITGKAGTGKSTLLSLFRKTSGKNIVVVAPTGVAALQVKGQTIHSFFRIPPKLTKSEDISIKKGFSKIMNSLEVLIIDEISMVRADLFDHIDYTLRLYRKSMKPFGGVKLLLFGDLYQLPPVVASDAERYYFSKVYPSPYFFSAKVFQQGFQLFMIELNRVFRQSDVHFIRILDKIRRNEVEEEDFQTLNERLDANFANKKGFITLTTTNAIAENINRARLDEIDEPAVSFQATLTGQFNDRIPPADTLLTLKVGAQVMFLRNDPEYKYVNGTIGKVTKLEKDTVVIEKQEGEPEPITVTRADWEMIRYKASQDGKIEEEIIGSFKQFPVKLAWAVTIHKSQGKTFDHVILDLGRGAFEYGQSYVALSRCRSLEGIVLKKPITPRDIMVDEKVIAFYDSIR